MCFVRNRLSVIRIHLHDEKAIAGEGAMAAMISVVKEQIAEDRVRTSAKPQVLSTPALRVP